MNVEDNRRVYEGKDAFLRLPTSFGKSVHYKVLSFACLTVNTASWVQGGVEVTLQYSCRNCKVSGIESVIYAFGSHSNSPMGQVAICLRGT